MATVVSVNVGLPQDLEWQEKTGSNRDLEASPGGTMNLAGDAQAALLDSSGSARTSLKRFMKNRVHDFHQSLWRDPFAQGCKSVHVAKHVRHHATLAFSGSEHRLLSNPSAIRRSIYLP